MEIIAPPPPAPPQETAAELLRALNRLRREGKLALRLDFSKLREIHSPVAVEADMNIWAYGTAALALVAAYRGWMWSVGVLVVGAALYYAIGRRLVRTRLQRRVEEQALTDIDTWQKLWRFGGVTLVARDGEQCAAPEGNWIGLVRRVKAENRRSPSR